MSNIIRSILRNRFLERTGQPAKSLIAESCLGSGVGPKSAGCIDVVRTRFDVIGDIQAVETLAVRFSIRELRQLIRLYGKGRWRKLKGKAIVRTSDGMIRRAEIHWYEAHGIGRRKFKIKRWLET